MSKNTFEFKTFDTSNKARIAEIEKGFSSIDQKAINSYLPINSSIRGDAKAFSQWQAEMRNLHFEKTGKTGFPLKGALEQTLGGDFTNLTNRFEVIATNNRARAIAYDGQDFDKILPQVLENQPLGIKNVAQTRGLDIVRIKDPDSPFNQQIRQDFQTKYPRQYELVQTKAESKSWFTTKKKAMLLTLAAIFAIYGGDLADGFVDVLDTVVDLIEDGINAGKEALNNLLGAILGPIAGVLLIALIGFLIYWFFFRKKQNTPILVYTKDDDYYY